jgi:hypothetical protein
MSHLVILQDPETGKRSAFFTRWYDADKHYNPAYSMVVVDLTSLLITFDGKTWEDVEEDHL